MKHGFKIGERVKIDDLELPGVVVSIWIQLTGTQYEVRFFSNGEHKQSYFFSYELQQLEGGK